jgi:hypothetical protein
LQGAEVQAEFARVTVCAIASVETTQIYTHVMCKPGLGVRSPFDTLRAGPLDAA